MARIYLDTNFYIDIIYRKKEKRSILEGNHVFISPFSTHVLLYAQKLKVPNEVVDKLQKQFGIVPLNDLVLSKALEGPTFDLEDNIQLHSAAEADCDLFLTNDKKLHDMKFFGKVRISHG